MQRFEGQVAVITGGASGIGRDVAERLLSEGASVAIWDLKQGEAVAAELGENARGFTADIADEASVTAAGITGPTHPVQGHDFASWRKVLDVHLGGVFLCSRVVTDGMVARNYGRIVTVASVAGKEGNPNASSYSAAKAGIIGFTKSLGKELALSEVRANCFAPGLIKTALIDQLSPEQVELSLSKIPQGRFGTIEECAAMIAFMVSPECSFNSGVVFDLSGGRATY